MWGAWCKTLVGGFSLGEWEPLCPRPTLPEAACNTAGGLGGAVSPPAGSGRERILAIMYIKFASNNVPGKISVQKKNPLWGAWSGRTIRTIVNPALVVSSVSLSYMVCIA